MASALNEEVDRLLAQLAQDCSGELDLDHTVALVGRIASALQESPRRDFAKLRAAPRLLTELCARAQIRLNPTAVKAVIQVLGVILQEPDKVSPRAIQWATELLDRLLRGGKATVNHRVDYLGLPSAEVVDSTELTNATKILNETGSTSAQLSSVEEFRRAASEALPLLSIPETATCVADTLVRLASNFDAPAAPLERLLGRIFIEKAQKVLSPESLTLLYESDVPSFLGLVNTWIAGELANEEASHLLGALCRENLHLKWVAYDHIRVAVAKGDPAQRNTLQERLTHLIHPTTTAPTRDSHLPGAQVSPTL